MPRAGNLPSMQAAVGAPSVAIGDSVPSKVLVLVHGAGHFDEHYHESMVSEIQQRLGKKINCLPVLYESVLSAPAVAAATADPSVARLEVAFQNELARDAVLRAMSVLPAQDVLGTVKTVNPPRSMKTLRNLVSPVDSSQEGQVREAVLGELERSFSETPVVDWLKQIPAPVVAESTAMGSGKIDVQVVVRQVVKYLAIARIREQVQGRVRRKLDEAMRFDEIVFVSHSLGSLVAFDVLAGCADAYGKISHWLTLGCPLLKVQRLGYSVSLGKITPATIKKWYNVYDTSDVVANAIGPLFVNPSYPIHDIFVDVGVDPLGSHDYLRNAETLDLIAEVMA